MSAPAITQRKILKMPGTLDRVLLRQAGSRLFDGIKCWILGDIATVHPTSLFAPEEDEMMFDVRFTRRPIC